MIAFSFTPSSGSNGADSATLYSQFLHMVEGKSISGPGFNNASTSSMSYSLSTTQLPPNNTANSTATVVNNVTQGHSDAVLAGSIVAVAIGMSLLWLIAVLIWRKRASREQTPKLSYTFSEEKLGSHSRNAVKMKTLNAGMC